MANQRRLKKKQLRMQQSRLPNYSRKTIAPAWGGGGTDTTPKRNNLSKMSTIDEMEDEESDKEDTPATPTATVVENWESREDFNDLPASGQKPQNLQARMENEDDQANDDSISFVGKPDSPETIREELKAASAQAKGDEDDMETDDKTVRKRYASLSPSKLEKQISPARKDLERTEIRNRRDGHGFPRKPTARSKKTPPPRQATVQQRLTTWLAGAKANVPTERPRTRISREVSATTNQAQNR